MSEDGEKPSYIDAILSTQFDECSIAAADACRRSHELLVEQDTAVANLCVIDQGMAALPRKYRYVDLRTVKYSDPQIPCGDVQLALDPGANNINTAPRPRLLAVFNGDMALPLAGFEKRTGGQCSYVQLGQEIDVDNLVVTNRDSRSEYVEMIRQLLEKSPLSVERGKLLRELIATESERHKHSIEALLPAALYREALRIYGELPKYEPAPMTIVNGGKNIVTTTTKTTPSPHNHDTSDKARDITIALLGPNSIDPLPAARRLFRKSAKEQLGEPAIQVLRLAAVTRSHVTLILADITPSGVWVGGQETGIPASLETLHAIQKYFCDVTSGTECKHIIGRIATLSDALTRSTSRDRIEIEWDLKLAKSRLADIQYRAQNQLLHAFEARKEFDTLLGPYSKRLERIIDFVGKASSKGQLRFSGRLDDRKVGKTRSDVDIHATLQPVERDQIRMHVSGRPTSLPDDEFVTLFDTMLYETFPNDIPADKLDEIYGIFTALKPDQQDYTY